MSVRPPIAFSVAALLSTALPGTGKIVVKPAMVSHCAEAAAMELGVMMNDVLTLPVERLGGNYHVRSQHPTSGRDATLFECQNNGKWTPLAAA